MGKFNERPFLIRALIGVFVIQFATVAYQIYSCQTAIRSNRESDKVMLLCGNATTAFNETGKLALTTFLALLVPSAAQSITETAQGRLSRRKSKGEPEGGDPNAEDKV